MKSYLLSEFDRKSSCKNTTTSVYLPKNAQSYRQLYPNEHYLHQPARPSNCHPSLLWYPYSCRGPWLTKKASSKQSQKGAEISFASLRLQNRQKICFRVVLYCLVHKCLCYSVIYLFICRYCTSHEIL